MDTREYNLTISCHRRKMLNLSNPTYTGASGSNDLSSEVTPKLKQYGKGIVIIHTCIQIFTRGEEPIL